MDLIFIFNLFREKIIILNKYMKKKNINFDLQMKARKYLSFICKEEDEE